MQKKDKKPTKVEDPSTEGKTAKPVTEETVVNEKVRKKFNLNEGTRILMG